MTAKKYIEKHNVAKFIADYLDFNNPQSKYLHFIFDGPYREDGNKVFFSITQNKIEVNI